MPIQQVIAKGTVPVKIWTDECADNTKEQLENLSKLPFLFKHIAVMPDCHWGMGSTVGSVIATKNAVIPAAVGVDIGCGMLAHKLNLKKDDIIGKMWSAADLRKEIEKLIPVGFNSHKSLSNVADREWLSFIGRFPSITVINFSGNQKLHQRAALQLGTLGGGNHFIEICVDREDNLWIMLHSGSRYLGKTLADKHMKVAKELMKKYYIDLPDPHLAYLVKGTFEYGEYMQDLMFAQAYAKANRKTMLSLLLNYFVKQLGPESIRSDFSFDCHHNYAAMENHFGENVLVTRKGAVRAMKNDLGIIPGSMGAKSYIVRGKGNPESFNSCSHGAGRKMGRREALRRFTNTDLEKATDGVECRKDDKIIDEIPMAYKDIDSVMLNQTDLVEPIVELKQIICVKG